VVEWVLDWYSSSYYSVSSIDDPMGPDTGSSRVVRGGSSFHAAKLARSAFRGAVNPSRGFLISGFRLVSRR
jgi:formylglycine-generating enzyme required for sulfatase activity